MKGRSYTVREDTTLLNFLFDVMGSQSRTTVRNTLSKGMVQVGGESVTAYDFPLKKGTVVTILPKGVSIARATVSDAREEVTREGVNILFEDESYIVVHKPSGLLTVSSARGSSAKSGKKEKTLYAILNAYVKVSARMQRKEDLIEGREPDRSTAKIWIVHRLDKGTSGVVVFAKTERAKDILQSKWKDLVIKRTYTAWLEGRLEKAKGSVQSYLVENPKTLKMYSTQEMVPDSQLAITHFKTLAYGHHGTMDYTLAEFSLQTGRKNQIRVHAADMGHPIAGDEKYGAQTNPLRRLALHAGLLEFRHPFTDKIINCTSAEPVVFGRIKIV